LFRWDNLAQASWHDAKPVSGDFLILFKMGYTEGVKAIGLDAENLYQQLVTLISVLKTPTIYLFGTATLR
jgi:hypothetical protein